VPPRHPGKKRGVIVAGCRPPIHALRARLGNSFWIEINTVDPTTIRKQQLNRKLTYETQPNHSNNFAESRIADSKPLHRNRAERGKGRFIEAEPFRYMRSQILRHDDELGVIRITRTSTRHSIARNERMNVLPDLLDDPSARIPERLGRIESIHHRPVRR